MSSYDYTFKILSLGDSRIQKSALFKRYCTSGGSIPGVDYYLKTMDLNDKMVKLQIWDIEGGERLRFVLPTYCAGAKGAFFIYDITNLKTLDRISEWITIVRQKTEDIPIILVGTELELAEAQRQVPREYGIQVTEKNGLDSFAEISITTGQYIDDIFEEMTKLMVQRYETR